MKKNVVASITVCALIVLNGCADTSNKRTDSANVSASKNVGLEYLRRQQSAQADVVVQYCLQNSPSTKNKVESAYADYKNNLDKLLTEWVEENPDLRKGLENMTPKQIQESEASMKENSNMYLEKLKQYEPNQYCAWMANELKYTNFESMKRKLNEYEARTKSLAEKNKP